jgi:hypothetical protein
MRRATLLAVLAIATSTVAGCARTEAASPPQVVAPRAPLAGRPRLVFFMNPNGRPCQMQDQVLRGMAAELGPRADVVYYRTTEPGDLARFDQFGIRSLPQLVVTDQGGAELRRATPGILSETQVRQLLGP